ncbi:RGR1 [Candida oxycetoniae]|uniref:Mediator of RNA polymerase II transcription subunit 14 n=1 Tax=Candida oxycetoniae TaxID=497107 RepID=A0AAI9WWM8_9ASCO|nr:RGR1 [Candida oxycetoniae]KAI3403352.2 RGR1 [Candida oxycetoniae]
MALYRHKPQRAGRVRFGPPGPPEIPHIVENLLPLSNILKFHAQGSYKQLILALENLAINAQDESDVKRKKYLLDVIVSLRQEFIKVYTLIKWSNVSKDVSKLIDLSNWFRLQEFNFEQLMFQLQGLKGFSAAKLPDFDIKTALEVLYLGRPILPSHNYHQQKPISPEKVLEVLRDLNLVLMTRFALIDVPQRFKYDIKDGRAYMRVEKEFEVSITMASDTIVEESEISRSNPFFMIDFKFLFGLNPETNLITYGDNGGITKLPMKSYIKLERIVNQTLADSGLQGLYDLLHKYTISFKLFLIARQLRELILTTKWTKNLQVNYQTGNTKIIVNYWASHYLSQNWKSFLEIGVDEKFQLNYRWFKNGEYESEETVRQIIEKDDIKEEQENKREREEEEEEEEEKEKEKEKEKDLFQETTKEIDIESIITSFVLEHSAMIMKLVADKLQLKSSSEITTLSPQQIMFSISPQKQTIMFINPLTGLFYFVNPTPIQTRLLKRINSRPPPAFITNYNNNSSNNNNNNNNNNKQFVSEHDLADWVIENLLQLKLEVFTKEVNNYLTTTEWIFNSIIRLNEHEISKLLKSVNGTMGYNRIQFYRRKHWPSTWFLIVMINGVNTKTYWWVARIKSIEATWVINHYQALFTNPELNYKFFKSLGKSSFQKIINHVILEELHSKQIQFEEIGGEGESELKEYGLDIPQCKQGVFVIHKSFISIENRNLLPLENSSRKLFLQIQLVNENNINKMYLKLFGKLKNSAIKNSPELDQLNMKIDESNQNFEIETSIDLNEVINETKKHFLNSIFDNLNSLNNLLKIIDQLKHNDIQILDNSMDNITIKVNDEIDKLIIKLPIQMDKSITLSTVSVHSWQIEIIIHFLNQYLEQNHDASIVKTIKYLSDMDPIFQAIKQVDSLLQSPPASLKLTNGLSKVYFDCVFNNLNFIQFMFNISSTIPNTKKIQKDKILISISFKQISFFKNDEKLIKVSMKNNLNARNVKFKKLFEMIFKSISEMERNSKDELINLDGEGHLLVKLNYDFLISSNLLVEMMRRITKCFIQYFSEN